MDDTETDNMDIICVEVPKQQTHILDLVIIQQIHAQNDWTKN